MPLYSVKMRASAAGRHISGAERIVAADDVPAACAAMGQRALAHAKGTPDAITITTRALGHAEILRVPALPVEEAAATSPAQARSVVISELAQVTRHAAAVWEVLTGVRDMRGAVLLDAATGARLEPDRQRGVRVTNMDAVGRTSISGKQRVTEARVLAAKVANHPDVLAEVCISDDPGYTTGYLTVGGRYVRVPNMKERGSDVGGRVFVVTGDNTAALIHYLEQTPVLVEGCGAQ